MKNSTFGGFSSLALSWVMFWGAGVNWEGPFPGQQLLYPLLTGLGIMFLLLATTVPLLGSGKSWDMLRAKARILLPLLAVGALAALATGWAPVSSWTVTPGAVSSRSYGIPAPWRIEVQRGCPPWCDLPRAESYYDPPFFVVDALFYLALGYVLLPSYERWRNLRANGISLESPLSPRLSNSTASLGIPGVKRVSLMMVLILEVSVPVAETALLWAVATPPLPACVPGCIPAGLLVMDSYFASSPTSLTLNIRNVGSGTIRVYSYSVSDTVNQFSNPNWSGPTIGRGSITPVSIIIDGQAFTFHWGGFYKIEVSISNQDGSCCEAIFTFQTEQLGMNIKFSSLNTTRDMILNITNTGPPTITLTAYYVIDSQGHWYNNTAWSGPTIRPGAIVTTDIIIDGNAFTFQPGSIYTIKVVDSTNTEYTIYVTS